MPFIVKQNGATNENLGPEAIGRSFEIALKMVGRNCSLQPYTKVKVPAFSVAGEITAFASPDSTFAVTKRWLDGAKKTIEIGIYDFTAGYVSDLLKHAMTRGVKVTLMLDTDHVKGEDEIFQGLQDDCATCVPAPSCASQKAHYFPCSHEKVIIVDGELCIVQSGNYSPNSIPLNVLDGKVDGHFRTGNRDMGIAMHSKKMAKFLTKIMDSDMKLELSAPAALEIRAAGGPPAPLLVESAPAHQPTKLFPSKTFKLTKPVAVQPVLSPDNYMQVVPEILKGAKRSVLIQQQYIHSFEQPVAQLQQAIADARKSNPKLDVRILLGKLFDDKALQKEKLNLENIGALYGLKIGQNIRYVDTTRLVHCHNKLILVDGETVLVSSQNWSASAVSENREAGLLFKHSGVARYFTEIFEVDWKVAQKELPAKIRGGTVTPESVRKGGFVEVSAADYQEV